MLLTDSLVIFPVWTAVAILVLAALPLNIASIVIGEFKYQIYSIIGNFSRVLSRFESIVVAWKQNSLTQQDLILNWNPGLNARLPVEQFMISEVLSVVIPQCDFEGINQIIINSMPKFYLYTDNEKIITVATATRREKNWIV